MRRSAAAMAGIALAGLAGTAIAVREFRLEKDIGELRSSLRAQNEQLNDILSGQEDLVRSNRGLVLTLEAFSQTAARTPRGDPLSEAKKPPASSEDAQVAALPPEATESAEKAGAMIDGAIGSGHWTEQNRDDLRVLLRRIPGAQRAELMRRLITALNARQLEFQVPGPPF